MACPLLFTCGRRMVLAAAGVTLLSHHSRNSIHIMLIRNVTLYVFYLDRKAFLPQNGAHGWLPIDGAGA